jgi:hypothetical protein
LQGSSERVHEDGKLVVVFVEGEPGRVPLTPLRPLDKQGFTPEADLRI